ncbi:MAG: hypothetical protein AAGD17_04775 [Bacteroidota bacterium]
MKQLVLFISVTLFYGCTEKKVSEQDLQYLNGYWEIQKVEFPDGQFKDYRANTVIDYIKVEEGKGIRKKVQPKLDGTYLVSDDEESFELIKVNEGFSFYYKNNLSERQEQLKALDSLSFSTQNEEGLIYHYTRFQPISIQL